MSNDHLPAEIGASSPSEASAGNLPPDEQETFSSLLQRIRELEEALRRWIAVRKPLLARPEDMSRHDFKAAWQELSEAEWNLVALSTKGETDGR